MNVCTVHFSPLTQTQYEHFEKQHIQKKLDQTKLPTPRKLTRGVTSGSLQVSRASINASTTELKEPVPSNNTPTVSPQRPISSSSPDSLRTEISTFDWFRFREKRTSMAQNNQPKTDSTQSSPQLVHR